MRPVPSPLAAAVLLCLSLPYGAAPAFAQAAPVRSGPPRRISHPRAPYSSDSHASERPFFVRATDPNPYGSPASVRTITKPVPPPVPAATIKPARKHTAKKPAKKHTTRKHATRKETPHAPHP